MKKLDIPFLENILDSIPDAAFIIDDNNKVVVWNKAIENISHIPRAEILGQDSNICGAIFYGTPTIVLADLIIDPAKKSDFIKDVHYEGRDLYMEGYIKVAVLGREAYYWCKASPIFDDEGNIIGAMEILRDNSSIVELNYTSQAANEQAEAAMQQLLATEEELRQQYESLQVTEQQLRKELQFKQTMLENMNELFYTFDKDVRLTFINKKSLEVIGYHPEELIGTFRTKEIFPDEDWEWIKKEVVKRLSTGEQSTYILPARHRDGTKKYLKINSSPLWEDGTIVGAMVLADDITEYLKVHEALYENEKNMRRIADNMLDLVSELDAKGNIVYVSPSHFKVLGYPVDVMMKMTFVDFVHPDDLPLALNKLKEIMITGKPAISQHRCLHADGYYIWTETLGNPIMQNGILTGIVLSSRDINERKRLERELSYLSVHDPLTNLYNRTYFEEEMARIDAEGICPVGFMVFDLDGLKLVNDTVGVEAGNRLLIKTAEILKAACPNGIIARVGGDEFAILLPNTNKEQLEEKPAIIQVKTASFNEDTAEIPLSLSIGIACKEEPDKSLWDTAKEAEAYMGQLKLHRSRSARSAVVSTLLKALEERDFITEGHGDRMQELAVLLGKGMGLSHNILTTLRLFAQFHDIGKVGVPDRILFKEGRLTPEEYQEMKRHAEIGQRIAMASPELSSLADLILKHHEWWNGEGYPLGIAGEDIPLECRVLAIADAYDAMTNDRPYRKAMTAEEAKAELLRCSGTQFDPYLVELFLKLLDVSAEQLDEHINRMINGDKN